MADTKDTQESGKEVVEELPHVPFHKIFYTGKEIENINDVLERQHTHGGGYYTHQCHDWLHERVQVKGREDHQNLRVFLTSSCTQALEMAACLLDVGPGDEVIMSSYTFVSTANAFCLRGAIPVFVDVDPTTFNMDVEKCRAAITPKTKVICPMHYGGVGCEMDEIMAMAKEHNIFVVEDCAQGLMASYKGKPLGSIGDIGTISFHHTKNIVAGEGGAVVINRPELVQRAGIMWEKGTNRLDWVEGKIDKYEWLMIGSSFLPSELNASFLYAQFCMADEITRIRQRVWDLYKVAMEPLADKGWLSVCRIPSYCDANAHLFWILMNNAEDRDALLSNAKKAKISFVSHYVPLHQSPGGKKFGRISGDLTFVETKFNLLYRLPMWIGITDEMIERVIACVTNTLTDIYGNK